MQTKTNVQKGSKGPYIDLLMQPKQAANAINKLAQNMAIKQDVHDLEQRMAFEKYLKKKNR